MRDAEEVAREVLGCCLTLADDGWNICETEHGGEWDCADEEQRIADLIRARDAEVRAATLAEFEWEPGCRDERGKDYHLSPGMTVDDVPPQLTRTRRLVGPWEPEP